METTVMERTKTIFVNMERMEKSIDGHGDLLGELDKKVEVLCAGMKKNNNKSKKEKWAFWAAILCAIISAVSAVSVAYIQYCIGG